MCLPKVTLFPLTGPWTAVHRDHWNISSVALYWANLTKVELYFPELPSLWVPAQDCPHQTLVEHSEGRSEAAALTPSRSAHGCDSCFKLAAPCDPSGHFPCWCRPTASPAPARSSPSAILCLEQGYVWVHGKRYQLLGSKSRMEMVREK